jgi:hypothetical protein
MTGAPSRRRASAPRAAARGRQALSARSASIQPILDLDAHVDELCDLHSVERLNGGRGRAIRRGGCGEVTLQIRIPPVRGQVTYFVALHEIGHLIGPGRSGPRLEQEAAAWRWALANAIVEPTQASRRSMGRRLRSYVRWAELRQHRRRRPAIPAQQSAFWRLLADLEA